MRTTTIGLRFIFVAAVLILTMLSLVAGQTTVKKAKTKGSAKDEIEIKKVLADSVGAWNRHDAKGFSMLFADDAEFIDVLGVAVQGRSAIEELHGLLFATTFKESHVMPTGLRIKFIKSDIAAVDSTWGMSGFLDTSERKPSLKKAVMIVSLIMIKEKGRWSIAAMHKF
ncbi:hypothetical protein BH18ACI4_BH18ACI4_13010 [soil metagenome]